MQLLIATVELRPYVFIFLAAFLFISIVNFGVRTTLLFTALTYGVSLACEWSSIHNGFPFGLYHYIDATRGREIWIAGVPFMDSLSFTFLGFASYTVALLIASPLYRRGPDLRVLDTWKIRRSPRVWLMAALFMVMVDMVVDPLSVRGDRWFLGKIFWYDPPGPYFGVPISNYLGWFIVAAIAVAIFQGLDGWLNRGVARPAGTMPQLPSRALLGPLLYAGIVTFGITMLFVIGAPNVAWASVFIYLPFAALILNALTRAQSYGDAAAIARHLVDFPYNAAAFGAVPDDGYEARPRVDKSSDTPQFCSSTVWVRGADLDPAEVTQLFGIACDRSHRRGERSLRAGSDVTLVGERVGSVHRSGMWCRNIDAEKKYLWVAETQLEYWCDFLDERVSALRVLLNRGFDVKIDFYAEEGPMVFLEFSPHTLQRIADLNVGLSYTFFDRTTTKLP
jgi:uncharacterized membrane protein